MVDQIMLLSDFTGQFIAGMYTDNVYYVSCHNHMSGFYEVVMVKCTEEKLLLQSWWIPLDKMLIDGTFQFIDADAVGL